MKYAKWWLPILLMAMITPFTPYLDLNIERYFYQGDGQFVSNAFTYIMYYYGVLPADIILGIAAFIYLLSFCMKRWKQWRNPALVFILTMGIGAGVIVHGVLKEHWGRPRPKQVIEFGGAQEFRPYFKPNFFDQPEPSKSFTCGHCTAGFCFFAFIFSGKRMPNRTLYWSGIILTLGLGISLSMTRMMQGGHFLSDTLMSALIMWYVAAIADWLLAANAEESHRRFLGRKFGVR